MMSFEAKLDNFFEMLKCDLDPVAHVKLLRVAGTTQMSYLDEFTINSGTHMVQLGLPRPVFLSFHRNNVKNMKNDQ